MFGIGKITTKCECKFSGAVQHKSAVLPRNLQEITDLERYFQWFGLKHQLCLRKWQRDDLKLLS